MAARFIYRYIFKRSSTFTLAIVITSMFFERAYDHACENIFEWINEGRLWSDIKHRYEDPTEQLSHKHNVLRKDSIESQKESKEATKND
ncbi:cytochrome b-c1 complex subunit 9-like [Calliopsis andreniformis]|uniref:cytochrome b-c1 complex subunit 9-like n=1 Tax=Calliopsis andreniformis TaxID=337506 RepID=UPI003FCDAF05